MDTLLLFSQIYPIWSSILVLIFGMLIGSFLNVVIYRFPIMKERAWQAEARAVLELPEPETAEPTFNLVLPASTSANSLLIQMSCRARPLRATPYGGFSQRRCAVHSWASPSSSAVKYRLAVTDICAST